MSTRQTKYGLKSNLCLWLGFLLTLLRWFTCQSRPSQVHDIQTYHRSLE